MKERPGKSGMLHAGGGQLEIAAPVGCILTSSPTHLGNYKSFSASSLSSCATESI